MTVTVPPASTAEVITWRRAGLDCTAPKMAVLLLSVAHDVKRSSLDPTPPRAATTAEIARAAKVAVLDWDVHHGNGTEAIFYERGDVLTVSIHQERNYPLDTGAFADRGKGPGIGANLNIPLPPGAGDVVWMAAMERLALPAIEAFSPDPPCRFSASGVMPKIIASVVITIGRNRVRPAVTRAS